MPHKKKSAAVSPSAPPFAGLTFCVSGDFVRSQSELKEVIILNGGHIVATPSKACQYLVADAIGSSKTAKAQKDGIPIVTEAWVDASIAAGKCVGDAKYFLSGNISNASSTSNVTSSAISSVSSKPATKAKGKGKRKAKEEEDEEKEEEQASENAEEKEEKQPKKKAKTKNNKGNDNDKVDQIKEKSTAPSASSSKKKKGKKAASASANSMDDGEDTGSAAMSPSSSNSNSSSSSKGQSGGRKPDRELPGRDSYTIVDDFACLLNQTNITGGRNNNKFYVIQLLRSGSGEHFVWTRWGKPGQSKLESFGELVAAVEGFESKFKDKTKNLWHNRSNFVKYDQKYILVETEEGGDGDADGDAPLGRLSKGQIEKGQSVLATLRTVLETGKGGNVGELSASYYTLIPTVVGRQAAPAISTLMALQEKEELLKFMLRMGFDEVDKNDEGLSPIDGVVDLPLPKSLAEAALGLTSANEIKSADARGKELAEAQAGKPQKKMDPHLYAAIMLYTSNAIYQKLNQALREEKRHKVKQFFRYLRLFLEALSTLPPQKCTLWRGISVDLSRQYTVGSTMTWWGVSSCTSDENVARNFMRSCGGKTTLLTIKAKTACDISCTTFFPHEKESLLAPGTQVTVISNKTNGNVTEITVEEVGQTFAHASMH